MPLHCAFCLPRLTNADGTACGCCFSGLRVMLCVGLGGYRGPDLSGAARFVGIFGSKHCAFIAADADVGFSCNDEPLGYSGVGLRALRP